MTSASPDKHAGGRERANGTHHVRSRASESSLSLQWSDSGRRSRKGGQDVSGSGYRLGDCLGKGAFGSVYRALNIKSGETVAIKQIKLENLPESELKVIMSEIDLLKNLNHPNIVKYHGYTKDTEVLNIILEYCENGSLHKILKDFGKFPENLVAIYMSQVLNGLLYLHEQGVIHRDIKGANILTTKEGLVKLADFGVATKTAGANDPSVVGTPYWMAPEVIELAGATTASDIWSLGSTVIELLDGKPPYHKLQPMAALFRIVNDDHPPLPGGASPAVRDFLMHCFQKDPNFRVSAKKLLKHAWIVNAKRAEAIEPRAKTIEIEKAIKSVQEWNEALAAPANGSIRKSVRPTSLSPVPPRVAAMQTPKHTEANSASENRLLVSVGKAQRPNPDLYRSPDIESNDWESDFENTDTLLLPSRFTGISNGAYSAENLKTYATFETLAEEFPDEEDQDRTVRSPLQFTEAVTPQTQPASSGQRKVTALLSPKKQSPVQLRVRRKASTSDTSTRAQHVPESKLRIPSLVRPPLYREDTTEDYSDLVDNDTEFKLSVENFKARREQIPGDTEHKVRRNSVQRKASASSVSPHWTVRSEQASAPSTDERVMSNGSSSTKHVALEQRDTYILQRTSSGIEIHKYADTEEDVELSGLLTRDGHSLHAGHDFDFTGPSRMELSITSSHEEDEEYDPFALLDEGFDEIDMEENIAREREAQVETAVQSIINSLNENVTQEELYGMAAQLLLYLRESRDMKKVVVRNHGLLPILEVLETCNHRDIQFQLLQVINEIIIEDPDVQQTLCFIGGIPIVTRFASKKFSTIEMRREAAVFVQQIVETSSSTLQMFISCGGLNVLVEFIEEDLYTERDLVLIGVNGIWKVFELSFSQGTIPKNDFCRILSRSNALLPLSEKLSQTLEEKKNLNFELDFLRLDLLNQLEGRVAKVFLHFSQSENYVKEVIADWEVLNTVLGVLPRMSPAPQLTMLKFLKNLSMLPSTHDQLQAAGAVDTLVGLLSTTSLVENDTRDVANQILSIMFYLCRINKSLQEQAAKKGIIPPLMGAADQKWALRDLALPILCEMAHSGRFGRRALWQHNGLAFYVKVLADEKFANWQMPALEAIHIWLQEETARVEQCLLDGSFSDAIAKCFNNGDAVEPLLEPLQKVVRLSSAVASGLATHAIFAKAAEKVDHTKKVTAKLALLKVLRDICEAKEDKCAALIRSSGLSKILQRVQQDNSLLVKEMALEMLRFVDTPPRVRTTMRRSSSSTMTASGQFVLPLSIPSSPSHLRPSQSSYSDKPQPSSVLHSPRSRPRPSISTSRGDGTSNHAFASAIPYTQYTPTATSRRPASRDSTSSNGSSTTIGASTSIANLSHALSSLSTGGSATTGTGTLTSTKSRLPRTRLGRMSLAAQTPPSSTRADTTPRTENITPTHKPAAAMAAMPKPSPSPSAALSPKRTRRQTGGGNTTGEARRYTQNGTS